MSPGWGPRAETSGNRITWGQTHQTHRSVYGLRCTFTPPSHETTCAGFRPGQRNKTTGQERRGTAIHITARYTAYRVKHKDTPPPEAYLCADVRPSLRPMKMTAVRGFQPTGNKNTTGKTTDSETPLKSEILPRVAGGRAHLGSVLLDGASTS